MEHWGYHGLERPPQEAIDGTVGVFRCGHPKIERLMKPHADGGYQTTGHRAHRQITEESVRGRDVKAAARSRRREQEPILDGAHALEHAFGRR